MSVNVHVHTAYRFLGAGLDGPDVGDLGLADDHLRDYTLDGEVHNLDWDKVLVGDVDKILGGGSRKRLWNLCSPGLPHVTRTLKTVRLSRPQVDV